MLTGKLNAVKPILRRGAEALSPRLRRTAETAVARARPALGILGELWTGRGAGAARTASVDEVQASIRRHLRLGTLGMAVLVLGLGGWASTTRFAGAVIASGQVVVDSNVKKVQHPTGGVVGELKVREGDKVKAGDLLVRLDQTVTKANLAIVSTAVDEQTARMSRLEAERDGLDDITFGERLTGPAAAPTAKALMAAERRLFTLRRTARDGQKAQYNERIQQLAQEIEGLEGQIKAKDSEVKLITSELDGVRSLYERKLVPLSRVTALERDSARIAGERSQLVSAVAQSKGRINETQLQIIQIDQDFRSDVARELRELQGSLEENLERKVAAEDQLRRTDLLAPQDGVVHQLSVHTVGGVVNPGEPVMLIVPTQDRLSVEARIAPTDIDKVHVGQRAYLRFAAFDQRTTPDRAGEVTRISPDLTTDPRTGLSYYSLQVELLPDEINKLKSLRLVPGMPIEAFIQTNSRTVMSYLMKPLTDQFTKAFRDN
jgi:HlyD family secretion protein